jgi:hypothetical protein
MNKLSIVLILVFLVVASLGFVYFQYFSYRIISLTNIENNPQLYNQVRVTLRGMVIRNEGFMFGPKYELTEFEPSKVFNINTAKQIALGLKAGPSIDLSNYVSYAFDGRNYTQITYKPVVVKGTIIYIGQAMDAPPFYLDLESIKIDLD